MNPRISRISRIVRDQYLRQSDKWDAGIPGAIMSTPPPTDALCRDCNALEDALAEAQTEVKLLQDQVAQLKAERVDLMKEVEELKAWKNGEHVRNFREMVDAQKDRDAAIARAENLAGLLLEAKAYLDFYDPETAASNVGSRIDAALAERGESGE